ncbi:MAG: transcriptional regulator [Actinobacteria bacterium RBG_19FT_COMBO_54_7]|uniref:Transcriptional regulator n=1 Tax=Candidatus Solincola sediminis TaxID=1797199 RepID=A0A1F2WIZ0_9ACTN|nr:MAG: transcriptional regulator [Candidatus Solincola sediminis]OFW56803.1 MAG: transcriptional regulator [Candidatus Solincola sediminis]OFW69385.1 MAG: transcriptional regulator [Actinobacteria bacterium RBG_19FT_COMBO_54_7]
MGKKNGFERELSIFHEHGGIMSSGQAISSGIHPRKLYAMRDDGILERVSRGWYRMTDMPPFSDPDLVMAAIRVPKGVVCLISALAFHGITTQVPHEIHIALPKGEKAPRLEHPPLRIYRFLTEAYTEGVEEHSIDGVPVRIYNIEKTLADCFKFRNKIGQDVAIEALQISWRSKSLDLNKLMQYARICRVENIMRPYLEALL